MGIWGGLGVSFGRLDGRFGHLGAVSGGFGRILGAVDGPNVPGEIWRVV